MVNEACLLVIKAPAEQRAIVMTLSNNLTPCASGNTLDDHRHYAEQGRIPNGEATIPNGEAPLPNIKVPTWNQHTCFQQQKTLPKLAAKDRVQILNMKYPHQPQRRGMYPEQLGMYPEQLGMYPEQLGMYPEQLGIYPEQ
jgi:hypothetical protein